MQKMMVVKKTGHMWDRNAGVLVWALMALVLLFGAAAARADSERDIAAKTQRAAAQFEPVPVPTVGQRARPHKASSSIVGFDFRTKQPIFIPEKAVRQMPRADLDGGSPGDAAGSATGGGFSFQNFSALSKVNNPSLWPHRVNVRMFMTWPNGKGGSCSGILIEPRTILTAGHCIYSHDNGGFATDIMVVPAYNNGSRPFGYGRLSYYWTWTGWTEDEDYDWDMAVVILDRPVGALTGAHKFGFNDDDDFFEGRTFYNKAYPAESPYTGQFMYERQGTWDDVGDDELCIDGWTWKGMSGSGNYTFVGNDRVVYAATSHRHGDGSSCSTRINGTRFYDIRDDMINATLPSSPDLVPLNVRLSTAQTTAGNKIGVDVLIYNNSSAAWNGTIPIQIRISSNATISTGDTLMLTHNWNGTIGARGAVRLNLTNPTIPTHLNGDYWVGVTLNVNDSITWNNATNNLNTDNVLDGYGGTATFNWDASKLKVKPNYNTTIVANNASGILGEEVTLSATLRRVSDNAGLSGRTLKFKVNTTTIGSATTNSSGVASIDWTIPTNFGSGNKTIKVEFAGDGTYNASSDTATLKIWIGTKIESAHVTGKIGRTVTLSATLKRTDTDPDLAMFGKDIHFYVDGTLVGDATTDSNGVASLKYKIPVGNGAGFRSIKAQFQASSPYAGSTDYSLLTVQKADTSLAFTDINVLVGEKATLKAQLSYLGEAFGISLWLSLKNKTVTFKKGDVVIGSATTDLGGVAQITYKFASAGEQAITVEFAGDAAYEAASDAGTVNVIPSPTQIAVTNVSGARGANVTLKAKLTRTSDGARLGGRTLVFKVDGVKVGTAVTSTALLTLGTASFSYKIPSNAAKGSHTIVVEFAGEKDYNASSGAGTLTVL